MLNLYIGSAAVTALLLLAWWWLRRRNGARAAAAAERIDTLTGWPPQATRILTTRERMAFGTLVRALPECMVLAQVPLARFLSVPKRYSYADWLRRLGHQCVDFAVCDMGAQVIAVVELQPAAGLQNPRARKRMARMARSLKAAKIPLLVWPEDMLPSSSAAREAILPTPDPAAAPLGARTAAPAAFDFPEAEAAPVATASRAPGPFDDTHPVGADEAASEALEAPPSTWFDDLDSGPVPLRKR